MKVQRIMNLLLAAVVLALAVVSTEAHELGHDGIWHARRWTLRHGTFMASFMAMHGASVILELRDGRVRAIPLAELGPSDVEFVARRMDALARLNGVRPPGMAPEQHEPHAVAGIPTAEPGAPAVHSVAGPAPHAPAVSVAGFATVAFAMLMMFALRAFVNRRPSVAPPSLTVFPASVVLVVCLVAVCAGVPNAPFLVAPTDPATIDSTFAPFKPRVATRWDSTYFYVESDGMPTGFPPMVGITAWQQQVPIPQAYTGANAWSIPLKPVIAAAPISTDTALFTGGVGLAVNGIPVFNAKNNRGEDSYAIGELDTWGGHCGRADDYHYHIAPLHLQSVVGTTRPIAWGLDGFPVYGALEPDGTPMQTLDAAHGHPWAGGYHYHGTMTYPYMIGAMRGEVRVENDQIVPQPRARGARPFTSPLRGAAITEFVRCGPDHFALKYEIDGHPFRVIYQWDSLANYRYTFVDSTGASRVETYKRR